MTHSYMTDSNKDSDTHLHGRQQQRKTYRYTAESNKDSDMWQRATRTVIYGREQQGQ